MNNETPNPPGMKQQTSPIQRHSFLRRRPVASYFAMTFAVSRIGAILVAAPHLLRDQPLTKLSGILMFPAMLLGPSFVGIFLTRSVDGPSGLGDLFSRMRLVHFPLRWYAALLIPPLLVLTVLLSLKSFVSPVYTLNRFLVGLAFGIPAGFRGDRLDGLRLSQDAAKTTGSCCGRLARHLLGHLAPQSLRPIDEREEGNREIPLGPAPFLVWFPYCPLPTTHSLHVR